MKALATTVAVSVVLLASCATPARPAVDLTPHAGAELAAIARAPAGTGPTYAGDVDGDGRSDRVLVAGDRLLVRRGGGGHVSQRLRSGSRLVGLADLGGALAVVTSAPAGAGARDRQWAVRVVDGDHLRLLTTPDREWIGSAPGVEVSWLNDARAMYTGSLDPLENGRDRRHVVSRRWRIVDGRLAATPRGTYCWTVATQPSPEPC